MLPARTDHDDNPAAPDPETAHADQACRPGQRRTGGQAARTVRDCRRIYLIPAPLLTPTAQPGVHIHVICINTPDPWLVCAPPLSLPPPHKRYRGPASLRLYARGQTLYLNYRTHT